MAFQFDENAPVLEIKDLNLSYWTRAGEIPAVIDFSLTVNRGESIGLVGESGCGKSTVAMAIMQYMGGNGSIKSGSIKFKGLELNELSPDELRELRGSHISMIYQEPFAALNPSLLLGTQLKEVPMTHEGIGDAEAAERALKVLGDVRLPDPERVMNAYPHQISGGQQQRVVIAMALLSNPSLLLLDEPTTALDVTVEAGITKLIADISREYGTSQIYISHNLGLILEVCNRVFVMYSGEVVEEGTINSLFTWPKHPYTHGLFGCIPLPTADKNAAPLQPIRGQLPLPHERPNGCNFGPRCDFFQDGRCDRGVIGMDYVSGAEVSDHRVRCVRWNEIDYGAEVAHGETQAAVEIGEEVLAVDGMQKYYEVHDRSIKALISGESVRYVKANESLDFNARRGETVAIVGESGCGKSTFAKVLMGPRDRHRRGGAPRGARHRRRAGPQPHTAADRLPPDGVSESLRHPQPKPHHRYSDRAGDQEVRSRDGQEEDPGIGCTSSSTSSSCREISISAGRGSSPGARSSASASRAPSPATPRW